MIGDMAAEAACSYSSGKVSRGGRGRERSRRAVSILLVDDRDADALRIADSLTANRDLDVEVELVSDPQEAARLWREGLHDVAMFDVWLGNKSSVGLFITLAAEAASRPVIVLSNLPGSEARALTAAASDMMVHSKDNLSPVALGMTLGAALAIARQAAVRLDA